MDLYDNFSNLYYRYTCKNVDIKAYRNYIIKIVRLINNDLRGREKATVPENVDCE